MDCLWVVGLPAPWTVLERETHLGRASSRPCPPVRATGWGGVRVGAAQDGVLGRWRRRVGERAPLPHGGAGASGRVLSGSWGDVGAGAASAAHRPRSPRSLSSGKARTGAPMLPQESRPPPPAAMRCLSEAEVCSRTRVGGAWRPLTAAVYTAHSLVSLLSAVRDVEFLRWSSFSSKYVLVFLVRSFQVSPGTYEARDARAVCCGCESSPARGLAH